jgi:hypothetical protein
MGFPDQHHSPHLPSRPLVICHPYCHYPSAAIY